MELSQFGFLYVGLRAEQPHQISHLDDPSDSCVSIFLVPDVDLGDGKISSSTAPATQFVDLGHYGFAKIGTFKRENRRRHLLKWTNVEMWGPDAQLVPKKTFSKNDVVQFIACTLHRGSGSGEEGEKVERLTCFTVHTTKKLCRKYQKLESPIMAPEILYKFYKHGETVQVKRRAKQLLNNWKTKLGSEERVMFNYIDEDASDRFTVDTPMGSKIRALFESIYDSSSSDEDGEFVL